MLLLTGHAQIWQLALLAALNGASSAFFFPASTGVIPQTVTTPLAAAGECDPAAGAERDEHHRRRDRWLSSWRRRAPGIGDRDRRRLVLRGCSDASRAMRVTAARANPRQHRPARAARGWRDFWSRTWLWVIVLAVRRGQRLPERRDSGARPGDREGRPRRPGGVGRDLDRDVASDLILCGFMMLRWRPRRILARATLAVFPFRARPWSHSRSQRHSPWSIACCVHGRLLHRDLRRPLGHGDAAGYPAREALRASSSYDMVGSLAPMPLALAAVGPISSADRDARDPDRLRDPDRRRDRPGPALARRAHARAAVGGNRRPGRRGGLLSRRMLPPETWASAITVISSMFTLAGRVSAKSTQSATSSAVIGPPIATFE